MSIRKQGNLIKIIVAAALMLGLSACTDDQPTPQPEQQAQKPTTEVLCSDSEFSAIDKKVQTADSSGHGPDIGSGEWRYVVEGKLGLRDDPSLPKSGTKEWCQFIESKLESANK